MTLRTTVLCEQPGFRIFTSTYAAGASYDAHVDQRPRISVVLRGQLRETCSALEVDATPASLVVKPADAVHRNRFGPAPVHLLTIEFTSGTSLFTGTCFSSWRWLHGLSSAPVVAHLMCDLSSATTPVEYEEAVIAMMARLPAPPAKRSEPPGWLQRIREQVQDGYRTSTSELAAEAGVHPIYLARRYRRSYGCSIGQDITRMRLERSLPSLAEGTGELVGIALDQGFADQSHFQRKFRSAMGITPGRFRKLCARFR